jgi:hypothetical protein
VALVGRAPQRLAVHREHAAVTQRAQPVGQPRPMVASTVSPSTRANTRRMVASPGTWHRRVSGSQRTPSAARIGQGASVAHSAIAVTLRAPAATAAALTASTLARGVPSARPVTGVGEHRQPFQQARAVAQGKRAGMVGVGDGGGNGGWSVGRHGCPSGHEAMRTAWSPVPVPVSRSSCQTTRTGHHGTFDGALTQGPIDHNGCGTQAQVALEFKEIAWL